MHDSDGARGHVDEAKGFGSHLNGPTAHRDMPSAPNDGGRPAHQGMSASQTLKTQKSPPSYLRNQDTQACYSIEKGQRWRCRLVRTEKHASRGIVERKHR